MPRAPPGKSVAAKISPLGPNLDDLARSGEWQNQAPCFQATETVSITIKPALDVLSRDFEERAAKRVAFLKERYGGGAAAPDNFLHSVSGASALFGPYAAEVADLRMLVRSAISSSTWVDEKSPSGPFGLTSVKGDS
jgi:hypothetical protein